MRATKISIYRRGGWNVILYSFFVDLIMRLSPSMCNQTKVTKRFFRTDFQLSRVLVLWKSAFIFLHIFCLRPGHLPRDQVNKTQLSLPPGQPLTSNPSNQISGLPHSTVLLFLFSNDVCQWWKMKDFSIFVFFPFLF